MSTAEQQLADLRAALRGYKAHFTRRYQEAAAAVELAQTTQTAETYRQLEKCVGALESAYEKIVSALVRLIQLDEDGTRRAEYDTVLEDTGKKKATAIKGLVGNMAVIAPSLPDDDAPSDHPAEGNGAAARPRPNDALRPRTLTADATPTEFRSWLKKFKAFFTTSRLDLCSIPEQQAYLSACIDATLEACLASKANETTPVYRAEDGDDSCIELLAEEFRNRYPLFTRRLQFFRDSQVQGQLCSDWVARLHVLAEEADVGNLNRESILVFRIVSGCTDEKLREKLLQLQEPNLQATMEAIRAYEAGRSAMRATQGSSATAAAVKTTTGAVPKQQSGGGGGKARESRAAFLTRMKPLLGKCFACASPDHSRKECQHKNAICPKCGERGHIQQACLAGKDNSVKVVSESAAGTGGASATQSKTAAPSASISSY